MIVKKNILSGVPSAVPKEIFETIASSKDVRIERIISRGQVTSEGKWYDQEKNEFVLVMKGSAIIELDNFEEISMKEGDYILIPMHAKHRVKETSREKETIWLTVFY